MFNAPTFRKQTEELLAAPASVIVDLQKCDYVDSSGMGSLVTLHKLAMKEKQRLYLFNPVDRVRSTFELVKIDKLFSIINDFSELD